MKRIAAALGFVLISIAGAAQATLIDIGGGQIQDDKSGLIWLQNWNVNGQHDWATQKAWAAALTTGNVTAGSWSLPSLSDYATLYAAFGNLSNVSAFSNLQSGLYWSISEYWVRPQSAWFYVPTSTSGQNFGLGLKTEFWYAVAVRTGDVCTENCNPVPVPATIALLALGLVSIGTARRKQALSVASGELV